MDLRARVSFPNDVRHCTAASHCHRCIAKQSVSNTYREQKTAKGHHSRWCGLAHAGSASNIQANATRPGIVETRSKVESMRPEDSARWAKWEEIAEAVAFLASDAATGTTGQVRAAPGRRPAGHWLAVSGLADRACDTQLDVEQQVAYYSNRG